MNNRAAQDTYNMYRCLMNTLGTNGMKKVSIWRD